MRSGDKYRLRLTLDATPEVEIVRLVGFEDEDSYYSAVEFNSPPTEPNASWSWGLVDIDTFSALYELVPEPEVRYYRDTRTGTVYQVVEGSFRGYEDSANHERVSVSTYSEDEA